MIFDFSPSPNGDGHDRLYWLVKITIKDFIDVTLATKMMFEVVKGVMDKKVDKVTDMMVDMGVYKVVDIVSDIMVDLYSGNSCYLWRWC